MSKRQWIRHCGKLCLEGYPIRIVQPGPISGAPFGLEQDSRATASFWTLAVAQLVAVNRADEIDQFTGGNLEGTRS